jgi:DNA-binding PadR family transcriptional regulator
MQTDGIEKEVLLEISKKLVISKAELVAFLENKTDNPVPTLEKTVRSLSDKGLIIYVSPIGQSCYAITQKGMREIR